MALNATRNLEAVLDHEQYDESTLVEMRVPLNLPYQNTWADFERFDGEIEIEGVHYKYVKRKVEKGELVVLCIPNEGRTKIESSKADYFRLINDLDQDAQAKKSGSFAYKGFFSEYRDQQNNWSISAPAQVAVMILSPDTALLNAFSQKSPGQPPEQFTRFVG